MASIIGSGINGNYMNRKVDMLAAANNKWLLLLEVELMETSSTGVAHSTTTNNGFYYWKWN